MSVFKWARKALREIAIRTKSGLSWRPAAIPHHWPMNWWQLNMRHDSEIPNFAEYPPVAACVTIISQDLSRIPLEHLRLLPDGSTEKITNQAPARLFRKPNHYQTRVNLLLYTLYSLLTDGNAYWVVTRNLRQEPDAFYPLHPQMVWPYIAEDGSIFYKIGHNENTQLAQLNPEEWLPQRYVFHVRGQTPYHPLVGESPLVAATYPTLTGNRINVHTASFFKNMGRPSGVLKHPGNLSDDAVTRLKKAWREITTGPNIGDVVVLREGMSWDPLTMSAVDAEVARIAQLSERQIAQLYRVPLVFLGDLDKSTFSNVENLMRFYFHSTLGYWESMIEEALTLYFKLPSDQCIKFNVEEAMLQSDFATRVQSLTRGIQGGLYKPDEARRKEKLPPAEGGDNLFLQQQMRPASVQAESPDLIPDTNQTAEENVIDLSAFKAKARAKMDKVA